MPIAPDSPRHEDTQNISRNLGDTIGLLRPGLTGNPGKSGPLDRAGALGCGLLGLASVVPLLAWVNGLGPFHVWFWSLAAPALAGLLVLGTITFRVESYPLTRQSLAVGTTAGLIGTIGYDLFRVPFSLLGFRLLAPIDSYGLLILNAEGSSPLTGFTGWSYHFMNGVGFAIFYAALFRGRHWVYGLVWAMVLETATVVTPFADFYGVAGKWDLIGLAYAAHVPYGLALGLITQRAGTWVGHLQEVGPHTVAWTVAVLVLALAAWHRPFSVPDLVQEGRAAAPGPSAVISSERLFPQWLRLGPGDCAGILNLDDRSYTISGTSIDAGSRGRVCFTGRVVQRIMIEGEPYSGGFVIIDPQVRT